MDTTRQLRAALHIIHSYGEHGFRIGNDVYNHSVILFMEQVVPVVIGGFSELTPAHCAPIFAARDGLDVVLIGTGKTMEILPVALRQEFKAAGLVVDAMNTGAACRTFNVLAAEGRRVAALLVR